MKNILLYLHLSIFNYMGRPKLFSYEWKIWGKSFLQSKLMFQCSIRKNVILWYCKRWIWRPTFLMDYFQFLVSCLSVNLTCSICTSLRFVNTMSHCDGSSFYGTNERNKIATVVLQITEVRVHSPHQEHLFCGGGMFYCWHIKNVI
jgi:hypothetical protein